MSAVRRLTVCLALSLGAAGCASGPDPALQAEPLYQLGYGDGCASAQESVQGFASTLRRNKEYAGKSSAYDAGWSAGFGACGGNPATINRPGDVFGDDIGGGRR